MHSGISDYQTKNFTADTGTCPERKECSKTSKIPKKPLQNCFFSINFVDLQTKVSDFNKYCNRLLEKKFTVSALKYLQICQEEVCSEVVLSK